MPHGERNFVDIAYEDDDSRTGLMALISDEGRSQVGEDWGNA